MITKKIIRVNIQQLLRKTYLLSFTEKLRFHNKVWRLRKRNKRFIKENPDFVLPPAHLAFDAYSSSHWEFYKVSGEMTAKFLREITDKYFSDNNPLFAVYEWGCGPARIIRQLPAVFTKRIEFHASDYNPETIEWCREKIPGIHFIKNELQPPLPYPDNSFDFIYATSVVTHLSEENGLAWINELYRVLKPTGILLITTDSDHTYKTELLPGERERYRTKGIVVRDRYEEGKKMFLTRHSPTYVREKLLKQFEVLEHAGAAFPFMRQDYWVARKNELK